MELINEPVEHRSFGQGRITAAEDTRITIMFQESVGEKTFCYPDAFEDFLTMCNPAAQEAVEKDLRKLLIRQSFEKASLERRNREKQARLEAERKALRVTKARQTKRTKATAEKKV